MRARIGTAFALYLLFGLWTPRHSDRPLAANTDGGRAASPGVADATSPAAAPAHRLAAAAVSIGPPALPTVAWSGASVLAATAERESVSEPEALGRELLHTDRLIAVLRPKVFRAGNAAAQVHFGDAIKRESDAREAYDHRLYARAARLTREARSLARAAAVMVGPPEEDPVYVSRTIGHAGDALGLADDILKGVTQESVTRRYTKLQKDLTDARELYKNGEMRRAHEKAVAVRDGVLDLLRDCDDLPVSPDTASKALKGAERALTQASKELGAKPNAPALRWQREAAGQLTKARSAFARREYRDAVIHSKLVERNLEQAISAQRSVTKAGVRSDA